MKLLWFIVLAFSSWTTFVSCNALEVTLHIGIWDRTMDRKTVNSNSCHDDNWFLSKAERSLQTGFGSMRLIM